MDLESVLVSVLLRTYGWEVLEEQQLDSGGLVLAVQTSGGIQQEEEQDASEIYWLMWAFEAWKIEEDRFE
jgi:hypothetical protein